MGLRLISAAFLILLGECTNVLAGDWNDLPNDSKDDWNIDAG